MKKKTTEELNDQYYLHNINFIDLDDFVDQPSGLILNQLHPEDEEALKKRIDRGSAKFNDLF